MLRLSLHSSDNFCSPFFHALSHFSASSLKQNHGFPIVWRQPISAFAERMLLWFKLCSLVRHGKKKRQEVLQRQIGMSSSFTLCFHIFIPSFLFSVKNNNKKLTIGDIWENSCICEDVIFQLCFLKRVRNCHKWEHFLLFFSLST